jgi:hypothetical protein
MRGHADIFIPDIDIPDTVQKFRSFGIKLPGYICPLVATPVPLLLQGCCKTALGCKGKTHLAALVQFYIGDYLRNLYNW